MRWFSDLDRATVNDFIGQLSTETAASESPRIIIIAISSADGRGAVGGKSADLGNDADLMLLKTLRETADVILVGSSTVKAEGYCGVGRDQATKRFGGSARNKAVPPIAVLTRSFELDPDSRFFTDVAVPPIVIGPANSVQVGTRFEAGGAAVLREAGATVIELENTAPSSVIQALGKLSFERVVIEGGPGVYRDFLTAGVVDEVFLTIAPMFVGDGPATFGCREDPDSTEEPDTALPLGFRAEAAAFSDSHLFVRYSRGRAG